MANLNELFHQQVNSEQNAAVTPDEEPELITEDISFDNEEEVIKETETALESLSDLYNNLVETGGLSRQLVLECLEVMPTFDGKRSINNYSSAPTNLRYKIALEELSTGMMAAIAAGIAVVIAIIAKLIKWLWPSKKGGGGTPTASDIKESAKASTEAVKETVPEIIEAVKDVEEIIKDLTTEALRDEVMKKGDLKHAHTLDDIIGQMYKTGKGLVGEEPSDIPSFFKEMASPITYDIMTFGPWTKNVHEVLGLFKEGKGSIIATQVRRKIEIFKKGINEVDVTAQVDRLEEELKKPILIMFNGKETAINDVTQILSEQRLALKNDTSEPKPWHTSDAVINAEKLNKRGDLIDGINIQANISLELLDIEKDLEEFRNTKAPDEAGATAEENAARDAVLAKFGQQLYSTVRGHVLDASRLTIEIKDYTSSASNVVSQLASISIYAAQQYAEVVKKQIDDPSVKEILKAALKKIMNLGSFKGGFDKAVKPRKQA